MTKVYIAGAITGMREKSEKWRKEWKKKLDDLFSVYDPLLDGPEADNRELEDTIVHEDLRRILTSDIILVNGNDPSWGTAMEIIYSHLFHTIVYTIFEGEDVPIWLDYHSDKVFKRDLDSFINWYKVENNRG